MSLRLEPEAYASLCQDVLKRDLWRCRSCGYRGNLHVHHIIFRSQQGPDEMWNLVTLCNLCHDGVHTAVHEGTPGLTIESLSDTGANGKLQFVRAPWGWRPQ